MRHKSQVKRAQEEEAGGQSGRFALFASRLSLGVCAGAKCSSSIANATVRWASSERRVSPVRECLVLVRSPFGRLVRMRSAQVARCRHAHAD